jgi:hypothetical protein
VLVVAGYELTMTTHGRKFTSQSAVHCVDEPGPVSACDDEGIDSSDFASSDSGNKWGPYYDGVMITVSSFLLMYDGSDDSYDIDWGVNMLQDPEDNSSDSDDAIISDESDDDDGGVDGGGGSKARQKKMLMMLVKMIVMMTMIVLVALSRIILT